MRNRLILSAAALTIIAGTAAGAESTHRAGTPREIEINGRTFRIGNPALKGISALPALGNVDGKRKVVGPNIITKKDIPESAVAQEYSKTSGGYYYYGGYNSYQDAAQAATVYWDGDDAYIWNILSYKETDSAVKGSRAGNQLTVPMNQAVDLYENEEGLPEDIKLGLLQTLLSVGTSDDEDDDGDSVMYIDFIYTGAYDEVNYTVEEDGTLTLVIPPLAPGWEAFVPDDGFPHPDPSDYSIPPYCLGFYYSGDMTWTGDGDFFQTYYEFNYEQVEWPENADFNYFSYFNAQDDGVLVKVAQTGNDLYFQGLSVFAPQAVFKGSLSDDKKKISIPQNQFIGKSDDGYYNLLTKAAKNGFKGMELLGEKEDAVFEAEWNEEGRLVKMRGNNTNNILVFNYADEYYDPYDEFPGVTLSYQATLEGNPMPPRGAYFEDHSQWLGAYWLFFYLSDVSMEGNILDTNDLYYRIYVNGEPFVFEEHEGEDMRGIEGIIYQGLTQPTTLVPYKFYNGSTIFYDEFKLWYVAFFNVDDFKTIGVQTVYTYGGKETCSEIQTIDVSGIGEVVAGDDAAPVYYDLQGHRVTRPEKGLYIKVVNGKAEKVIL